MAKRLTQDEWRAVRAKYEGDPAVTFAALAAEYGISKQAISARSKADGWARVSDPRDLARKARERADVAMVKNPLPDRVAGGAGSDAGPLDETPAAAAPIARGAPLTDEERAVAEDHAVGARARIIDRHRREWDGVRNIAYRAMKVSDFEVAKLAKITSETIRNIHDGERKAWGLEEKDEGLTVVVERRGA
jgi:hypothetical protein